MPQAMEWSLATPITRPRLPCISLPSAMVPSPCWVCSVLGQPTQGRTVLCNLYAQVLCMPLEDQRRVGAAEAKGIGQGGVDLGVVDTLANDVRVGDGGVDLLDIGAFANEAGLHHQQRIDRLVHAGGALAVAGERFGGA